MERNRTLVLVVFAVVVLGGIVFVPRPAGAHCDTLDGPVVAAAQVAIEKGDVTPVLMWVMPEDEQEIRALFTHVMAVRGFGPEAQEMADTYFFETLVRIHREGEGAPYTGLKPAGEVDPAVAMADQALESGSVDRLATALSTHVDAGVRERFAKAHAAIQHADDSVAAGREFVEAYVEFTHYVEGLHQMVTGGGGHHGGGSASSHEH